MSTVTFPAEDRSRRRDDGGKALGDIHLRVSVNGLLHELECEHPSPLAVVLHFLQAMHSLYTRFHPRKPQQIRRLSRYLAAHGPH